MIKNRKNESHTFGEFNRLFQDPKMLITLTGFASKKFKIAEASTERMMSSYFIYHGMNRLETCAMILREFVNPSKKIGKKRIRVAGNMPLIHMVIGISQELGMDEFKDLFPLRLHAVMESSSWYLKDGGICIIDEDGNGDSFTQKEFADVIEEFDSNLAEIIEEWVRRNSKREMP